MATFTPRGNEDKGWLGNQLDAFAHMNELGCDVFESAIAAISGHKMTPELAALCIATYWRRYTAICNFQESRGAAITLQVRACSHAWPRTASLTRAPQRHSDRPASRIFFLWPVCGRSAAHWASWSVPDGWVEASIPPDACLRARTTVLGL